MIYHDGKQEVLAHNPLEVQCKEIKTLIQRISGTTGDNRDSKTNKF